MIHSLGKIWFSLIHNLMNTMSPLSANLSCTMQILIWRNQSQNIDQHFIWQFLYPRISLHDCDKIHFRFIWQIFKKYFCKMYCCFDLILVLPVIFLQKVAISLRKKTKLCCYKWPNFTSNAEKCHYVFSFTRLLVSFHPQIIRKEV